MDGLNIIEQMHEQLQTKSLLEQAKSYAFNYINSVDKKRVYPSNEVINSLQIFDEPMPKVASDATAILKMLDEYGSAATVAQAGGRYFGFVTGGSIPIATAAKWLSDVWDQNSALFVCSPIAAKLEEICEKWIVDLLGLSEGTVAGLVGGTSNATFCGLAAGRNELLRKLGWDVTEKGLFNAPKLRVVLSEQAHASVIKALSLLGFGKDSFERVPVDAQGRIILDKMPALDNTTMLILQAGNVNTGAFDPIDELCNAANEKGAWVHIDGAFGLWAAASESKKFLIYGLDKADSYSVDAHKTLNLPYDCGIVLCKNKDALVSSMQATASYLQYSENRDGMLYTNDMSRRARAVELWAVLKYLGSQGVNLLIDRLCSLALTFSRRLQENGFNILNDVVFNQILVSCDTDEKTRRTLNNIQNSGECWCGGVIWQGSTAIRVSICSWVTSEEDMNKSLQAFIDARDRA